MDKLSTNKVSVVDDIYDVLVTKGLEHKHDNQGTEIIVKDCPFCPPGPSSGFNLYINKTPERLGLYKCHKCNASGNWNKLRTLLLGEDGLVIDVPYKHQEKNNHNDKMEVIKEAHKNLLADYETMQWLLQRNISVASMQKYQLGVATYKKHPEFGNDVKVLFIPHFFKNNLMNVKFRSLPPAKKGFNRIPGSSSVLFNYDNIDHTKNYIYICEGELDAISLVQAGESNVVGITVGARSFSPEWFELLKDFQIVYIVMDNDRPGQEGAEYIAERLGKDRCYNILLPNEDGIKDINDYFKDEEKYTIDNFKGLTLKATKFMLPTIYSLDTVFNDMIMELNRGNELIEGIRTPWGTLNERMGVIAKGDLVYLSGKPKSGKCVHKHTKLLTNIGLVSIEEIFNHCGILLDDKERSEDVAGKKVFVDTSSGRKQVTHFTINGKQELLEVKTKLGISIKVTKNHPLKIMNTTGQLVWRNAEELKIGDYLAISRIEFKGNEFDHISKEEARFIGYLIADGSLNYRNRVGFSNSNIDVVKDFKFCCNKIFPNINIKRYKKQNSNTVDYHINSQNIRINIEHKYGLNYIKAADKCIPLVIRSSSSKIWKEFLSAYFECESYINTQKNTIEVTSASKKLIDDIQFMLLSLGIVSRQRIKNIKGYEQPYYELLLPSDEAVRFISTVGYISNKQKEKTTILLQNNKNKRNKSNDIVPYQQNWIKKLQNEFPNNNKLKAITNRDRHKSHTLLKKIISYIETENQNTFVCNYWHSLQNIYFDKIISIKNIGEDNTYDLVQPETHEFIGNGIINHNTTFALNLCYHLSYKEQIPTLLFCLEMPPRRLAAKLVSLHRQQEAYKVGIEDVMMARADLQEKDTQLYFGYTGDRKYLNSEALFKVFENAKKKYGIELLVFDNLHYLSRSITHTSQEISKISRDFKLMAMNLNMQIIVIVQPRKLDDNALMTSVHLKDSSAMEADADTVLICHRQSLPNNPLTSTHAQQDALLSPIMTVTVDRTRYAQGGYTKLMLDGAKSYIREATIAELEAQPI